MSHARARSGTTTSSTTTTTDPHPVSLKVLRLSRPSLAAQTPLPRTNFNKSDPSDPETNHSLDIAPSASVAYPSAVKSSKQTHNAIEEPSATFPLTPLLTLPPAFGAAYVGETFSCALCVNDESLSDEEDGSARKASAVRIEARLQTPGNREGMELELEGEGEGFEQAGGTLQRVLRCELREEGPHVLAVSVSYTEIGGDAGGEGRSRTFRKLYQFVAQQLVAVRSKITTVKSRAGESGEGRKWVLEAQMQNVGDSSVVLESLWLEEREGLGSRDFNGGVEAGPSSKEATVLKPQDVEQVMWLLEEEEKVMEEGARVPLARLNLNWRGAMGEKGSLTTGWLTSRGR
ncbi:hypothetical protein MBLNU230_g6315t1 [Neophaeotheca triangularis]